jgi:formylglycine-generating enzyme required for sulfatase activity
MVAFPGAVFPLGYDAGAIDEKPVHDVSFPTFLLQIDEVTVVQYARCVTAGQCTPAGTEDFCNAGRAGRDLNPINCVSQPQAVAYCAWLGRRLPTEDEWEFAASGKAKRLYAWGNTSPTGRVCWGRRTEGTCDVSAFDAGSTPEGLHDITGNVWEWTSSDYCMYDTTIACARDQKVARGGGWFSTDPNVVRTQVRQGYAPATRSANVGIRCAKAL